MMLKNTNHDRSFRRVFVGICAAMVLACMLDAADGGTKDDVAEAKQVYLRYYRACQNGDREEAMKLAWIPAEYLRPLIKARLELGLEYSLLYKAAEEKLGPLTPAQHLAVWGTIPLEEKDFAFTALDVEQEHKPIVVEEKLLVNSFMVMPLAWVMPTKDGYRVNVLPTSDPTGPIPQHPDDYEKNRVAQQLVLLPLATKRCAAMRARVESGEFKSFDAYKQAMSALVKGGYSGATTRPSTLPSK